MHIAFSPVRMDADYFLTVAGDTVTLNGEVFDFSPLPEGAVLPHEAVGSAWFVGDVSRTDGELHMTLVLPHGADAPEMLLFPRPVDVREDGVILTLRQGLPHDFAIEPENRK